MHGTNRALALFLVASLGLACDSSGLSTQGAKGGQSGSAAGGSAFGAGGSAAGGLVTGGAGSFAAGGTGGLVTGGAAGGGGTGGVDRGSGGSAAGGVSGTGGSTCPWGCPAPSILCPGGTTLPERDSCGCAICAPTDAGIAKDATGDAPCLQPPCASYPVCPSGYQVVTPTCGCPTCVAVDAGLPDANACPPKACPTIACLNGMLPNPDPCDCPICAPADAGIEAAQPACIGLDECTCRATSGCGSIAQPCYCPFPTCDRSGACVCGGGKFVGCAPTGLGTCAAARDRVASLCPQLSQSSLPSVCDSGQSAPECIIKCLNDVGSCRDVACSFCETCDCAGDAFYTCLGKCRTLLTGNVGLDASVP